MARGSNRAARSGSGSKRKRLQKFAVSATLELFVGQCQNESQVAGNR